MILYIGISVQENVEFKKIIKILIGVQFYIRCCVRYKRLRIIFVVGEVLYSQWDEIDIFILLGNGFKNYI